MMDHGQRGQFIGQVVGNRLMCRAHYWLSIAIHAEAGFPATRPGQFVQLNCNDMTEPGVATEPHVMVWSPDSPPQPGDMELVEPQAFLRRPFSLAGHESQGDRQILHIVHRVVGLGTGWLAALAPGDTVSLIGPLGNAFDLSGPPRTALLIGGGVGLPPMFYLAEALAAAGWDAVAFIGALQADLLSVDFTRVPPPTDASPSMCVKQFADHGYPSVITTDDGSCGMRGRITDGLNVWLDHHSGTPCTAFVCGPEAMMHAATMITQRHGIPTQLCMEQAMACGMGTCQSCVLRIEDHELIHGHTRDGRPWRYRLACTDGPVFDAKQVVWPREGSK